ncbi:CBS domain-containing protein, partial [Pararhodobacter marinus]
MLVSQILKNKAAGIVTIGPKATLREVVDLLSTRRIGAVVVSTDGKKVKGIVSERDIVRELGRAGPEALNQPVEKVMTRAIYGCAPGDNTDTVLETMTTRRFRHMPVMEDNVMVGFISIG